MLHICHVQYTLYILVEDDNITPTGHLMYNVVTIKKCDFIDYDIPDIFCTDHVITQVYCNVLHTDLKTDIVPKICEIVQ